VINSKPIPLHPIQTIIKKSKLERKLKIMTINQIKRENNQIHLEVILCARDFEQYFVYCEDCGELILKEKAIELDDEYYCNSCVITCDCCGSIHPRRSAYTPEDSDCYYCRRCYENDTYLCQDCGRRYRYSDSITEVDGEYYCYNCIDNHRSPIDSYHTFKSYGDINFYGDEKRSAVPYMGLELEVDTDCQINRTTVINKFKDDFGDFMHYEEDGSLHYGWENISQPASLSYHLGMMNTYEGMFEILKDDGLRSHDTSTCGLHIHIDRKFFGDKEDSSIAKCLYLFEKFRSELMVFSRRTETQANDWARSRKYSGGNKGWIKKAVKDSKFFPDHSSRYYAVNLTNSETIEIRIWKGTLNIETFSATLRFTDRIARLCKTVSASELAKMTFADLLGSDKVILSYWNRINN
jgi:hypothetical protein